MSHFLKSICPLIALEGWPIIGTFFLTWLLFLGSAFLLEPDSLLKMTSALLSAISFALILFSLWFFRDPERTPETQDPNAVISAADGTVLKVEKVTDSRYGASAQKISIFMSPLNVHVNRAPVSGTVEKVDYVPGKFFAANLDKASTENERNWVSIQTEKKQRVAFLQIAGFIARRIVCHVKPGQKLHVGERYGMIRFGSRMELFLPEGSRILVKSGDKILAGHTQIGTLP